MYESAPVIRKAVIGVEADPKIAKIWRQKGAPLMEEVLVVDKNGGLRDAIVYVSDGLPNRVWPVPTDPFVLRAKDGRFEPHVFVLQTKQPLEFRNEDPTDHNLHLGQWSISQPRSSPDRLISFNEPGIVHGVKCDIHPWMNCHAGVFDHPFAAVSAEDGSFALPDLEAGRYRLTVWHAKLGSQELEVTLDANEFKDVRVVFDGKKAAP